MLVSLQNHLICSPEPVLELENEFIQEGDFKLIILQSTSQEVSLLLLSPEMFFFETLTLSSLGESKEENIDLDPKIPTALKVIINRLSFKKVSSLKLSATFSALIFEKKAFIMS